MMTGGMIMGRLMLCLLPLGAQATEVDYTQPMEGVYSQFWRAQEVRAMDAYAGGPHRLYVEGQGKMGEFQGVLDLDCATPTQSRWLIASDYLAPQSVPEGMIARIRAAWCVDN